MKILQYSIYIIFQLLFISSVYAQNLVPNASFESFKEEAIGQSLLENASYWENANQLKPGKYYGTPDHMFLNDKYDLKKLQSTFYPQDGKSAMGLITYMQRVSNYREYGEVKLLQPLQEGEAYRFTFYVNGGNKTTFGNIVTNGLGVSFTKDRLQQYVHEPLEVIPHFSIEDILYTTQWQKVTFDFIAEENYQYLTIGNFKFDHDLDIKYLFYDIDPQAYVFVDQVSLFHIPKDELSEDVKIIAQEKPAEESEQTAVVEEVVVAKVEEEKPKEKDDPLKGRELEEQYTFELDSDEFFVRLWDDKTEDGDIVSLLFNGKWVLKDYTLREKKKLKVDLKYEEGKENVLVMFAHSLGDTPPCTAAILISSKNKAKVRRMHSDLGTCGAIRFTR
ncbi:hypothetical protein [Sediminitomix flava]|uniref:Uncharacterized protein n=1 Tax=Sediminitomix flava TaxID=379075 RepID=A0A315Z8P6_SEDFL|nr:hypothetical protein [Sediminitomix flava]PWJ41871.1 hypothetical protein BC781_103121 [Sediminitomix flava]